LLPMAITSTNGMIKRIGAKNWQWLHKLIYIIGPLGILHFWWMKAGKHDFERPILYGSIIAALLLLRVYWSFAKRKQKGAQASLA